MTVITIINITSTLVQLLESSQPLYHLKFHPCLWQSSPPSKVKDSNENSTDLTLDLFLSLPARGRDEDFLLSCVWVRVSVRILTQKATSSIISKSYGPLRSDLEDTHPDTHTHTCIYSTWQKTWQPPTGGQRWLSKFGIYCEWIFVWKPSPS